MMSLKGEVVVASISEILPPYKMFSSAGKTEVKMWGRHSEGINRQQ